MVQDQSSWRSWLPRVATLDLVYLLAYGTRQVPSLVVGPLRQSLHLSDVQIGLIQGFAFLLVYAISALVLSRIVDRGNRVRLVVVCLFVWSVLTVVSGLADDFAMLLITRIGMAMSQSIIPVTALSIIYDITPRASVPRASVIFMMAAYIGGGAAFMFGGPLLVWLGQYQGQAVMGFGSFEPWRGVFILAGLPGIVVGFLIFLFMREPQRRVEPVQAAAQGSLIAFLRHNARFLLCLMTMVAMINLVNITVLSWIPAFLMRVHHMAAGEAGVAAGITLVASGICGCMLGTYLMSQDNDAVALSHVVRMMVKLVTLLFVPLVLMPLMPLPQVGLGLLALDVVLLSAILSSALTPLQLFAGNDVRGRAMAVGALYTAAISGLGPVVVGALTDRIFHAPEAINYALAITFGVVGIIAMVAGWPAARMALRIDRAAAASRIPSIAS